MRLRSLLWLVALGSLSLACGEDPYHDPPVWDAAPRDARTDGAAPDAAPMPDRPVNLEGPTVVIQAPVDQALLTGSQVQVVAQVTDPDGVDTSTVAAVIAGGLTFSLTRSGTQPDTYVGLVDIRTIPTGTMRIDVQAADVLGNLNSASVEVLRDTGPVITFLVPEDGDRFAGALSLDFLVSDPSGVDEASVTAAIGLVPLAVVKRAEDPDHGATPQWIEFGYEIVFDDPMFAPPLAGEQQISVTATNLGHDVSATGTVTFVVDDEGPVITLVTPVAGEIVGGIIDIEAEISDEAGILSTSVKAVLGNQAESFTIDLLPVGTIWRGAFDTRQLSPGSVFPTISVRAADLLNNESSVGYLIALDNTPPILSLDPPENFRVGRINQYGQVECSWQFDPVGGILDATDAVRDPSFADVIRTPDDLQRVPQVFYLWARIEDQGNEAMGLVQTPLSLVVPETVFVYFLDDTTQPLIVDTDDNGECDAINPTLVPSTNPQGADEILALNLIPVDPAGSADFLFGDPTDATALVTGWAGCQVKGNDNVFPERLCPTVLPTIALGYTATHLEPSIWTLPPQDAASLTFCLGHQFDTWAANLQEGWLCVAVQARDYAGNWGVSDVLRLCVDYDLDGNPACGDPPPTCRGTQDPDTGLVTSTPCTITSRQTFPDNEVRIYQ